LIIRWVRATLFEGREQIGSSLIEPGKPLVTLKDAADYIMRLPKKVHDAPHRQLAMEQLIDAAEGRNFIMHARIAVLQALNHGLPDPRTGPRRKAVQKHRIIR
jgi:hypothetical protein